MDTNKIVEQDPTKGGKYIPTTELVKKGQALGIPVSRIVKAWGGNGGVKPARNDNWEFVYFKHTRYIKAVCVKELPALKKEWEAEKAASAKAGTDRLAKARAAKGKGKPATKPAPKGKAQPAKAAPKGKGKAEPATESGPVKGAKTGKASTKAVKVYGRPQTVSVAATPLPKKSVAPTVKGATKMPAAKPSTKISTNRGKSGGKVTAKRSNPDEMPVLEIMGADEV